MSQVTLQLCLAYADQVERAVLDLRAVDSPLTALPARCDAFRQGCQALASNRGLHRLTIAFIGPRNAGKTTLASLFVANLSARTSLPSGEASHQSTRQILWLGPERPAELDDASEQWVPCGAEGLIDLGFPYQIADVPGFNDRVAEVREAAARALASALVKVLVVDERRLEAAELREYLAEADGAIVLPIINRATVLAPEDAAEFAADLRRDLPHSEVLAPVVVADFNLRDQDEVGVQATAREAITQALGAVQSRAYEWSALATPQLQARLERFQNEVTQRARGALPATAEAVAALDQAERRLPAEVLQDVLGPDRALHAVLRQRLRAIWLDNTPALFFPWRLVLGLAHLTWGAWDRVPLVLAGSLPSLVSVAWTAARNVRRASNFRAATTQGLRDRVATRARERLAPLVESLNASLAADLGRRTTGDDEAPTRPIEAQVNGITALQERSTAALDNLVEERATRPLAAFGIGLVGCLLFWVVAAWPLYALYLDYYRAATGTWMQVTEALHQFPTPSISLLFTTALLGLVPMALWLLVTASWVVRTRKVHDSARAVRLAHEEIIRALLTEGLLRVRLEDRQLAACRVLLAG